MAKHPVPRCVVVPIVATLLCLQASASVRAGGGEKSAKAAAVAGLVGELRATNALLAQANHDYQGHRVRAMEHIQHAIRALTGAKQGAGKGAAVKKPKAAGSAGGKVKEPQAKSDAQLRQAYQNLVAIRQQLAGQTHPRAVKAGGHVQNAISELETALAVR